MPTVESNLTILNMTRINDKLVHVTTDDTDNFPEYGEIPVHTTEKIKNTQTLVSKNQIRAMYNLVKRMIDAEK
jgi:hypothetical protein